jgi:splicing factor 3B subunit 3
MAVGDYENTVRVFSLDTDDMLQSLSVQALPTQPQSICIADVGGNTFINVGLNNGVLLRSTLDSVTGEISDTRTRFMGARGVRLFRIKVRGEPAVLALSSRSWLLYNYQARFQVLALLFLVVVVVCCCY